MTTHLHLVPLSTSFPPKTISFPSTAHGSILICGAHCSNPLSSTSNAVFAAPLLSRHAEISYGPDGFLIHDLGEDTCGTAVNGTLMWETEDWHYPMSLEHHDELELGFLDADGGFITRVHCRVDITQSPELTPSPNYTATNESLPSPRASSGTPLPSSISPSPSPSSLPSPPSSASLTLSAPSTTSVSTSVLRSERSPVVRELNGSVTSTTPASSCPRPEDEGLDVDVGERAHILQTNDQFSTIGCVPVDCAPSPHHHSTSSLLSADVALLRIRAAWDATRRATRRATRVRLLCTAELGVQRVLAALHQARTWRREESFTVSTSAAVSTMIPSACSGSWSPCAVSTPLVNVDHHLSNMPRLPIHVLSPSPVLPPVAPIQLQLVPSVTLSSLLSRSSWNLDVGAFAFAFPNPHRPLLPFFGF
ncbi:hypothetical protein A4X13_0g8979 [Tilletia indica]|uniref:Uncharacterized protein n=1 Tax=Tilletia indica TaxID=43049 RepID=A0A177SYE9_9BASI|nr:hypothetical protein A4X13_0g8979 [Tilletia indica]